MNNAPQTGIFINGRKQVEELIQHMESADKHTLLKNIQIRNPAYAKELTEKSIVFNTVWELKDQDLKILLNQINPKILGLALSISSHRNQKRALSLVNRPIAEKAFDIMQTDLSGNRDHCIKAQNKIKELAINLFREKVISFY